MKKEEQFIKELHDFAISYSKGLKEIIDAFKKSAPLVKNSKIIEGK